MTINSWKKVISDKPAIYTENKNEIYIDWFSVGYPSPERRTMGGKPLGPPCSLPVSLP